MSSSAEHGIAVDAASFLREREIVLHTELLAEPEAFGFILVHELFHFVWRRLGNRRRAEFSALILQERVAHARGELGDSSAFKKQRVADSDRLRNSVAWRDYICESFCDTAAWLYADRQSDASFTLARRWQNRRADWFRAAFKAGCTC
ncbi:MAG TPA: hypothetical protein VMF91_16810 [Bryobacteraceae bacterium]|nr:hypothetical protein [Bryobacteraceae bacterium]